MANLIYSGNARNASVIRYIDKKFPLFCLCENQVINNGL